MSAIYLVLPSPISFSDLPLGIGRAALHAPIYMTLQPIRRTASSIAGRPGELLPHLFTLTGQARRFFSVTLLCPHEQLPVRKYGALCCPDVPLTYTGKRQTGRLQFDKGSAFFQYPKEIGGERSARHFRLFAYLLTNRLIPIDSNASQFHILDTHRVG